MIEPGDKNSLGHYVLEVRKSVTALEMATSDSLGPKEIVFNGIGLFFCPFAGAEGLFATGRINLNHGNVNIVSYEYFNTLGEAEFDYRHGRSRTELA